MFELSESFTSLGLPPLLAGLLAAVIKCVLLLTFVAVSAIFFIWLERKVAGRIQDRLGPTRVGGKFGWLQTIADGVKLLVKEDLIPADADQMLFRLGPYIAFCGSFAAFVALPFANGWVAYGTSIGVFLMLAIMSSEVFGIILAGYGSGSKWALFGGMREAAQMVSYEVPMALCVLVPVIVAGSMDLNAIANRQGYGFFNWYVFNDPFTFCAFWTYFTCATASCKRAPFDLAEAESELVAGFHTEYSGLRWSFFFMAEYGSMFAVSGIAILLFLGGWHTGIPYLPELSTWFANLLGSADSPSTLGFVLGNVINVAVFIVKGWLLVFVMMWVRWTLPRLRIDQVMMTCLKYLLPISCVLLLGVSVWQTAVMPYGGHYFKYLLGGACLLLTVFVVARLVTTPSKLPTVGVGTPWGPMGPTRGGTKASGAEVTPMIETSTILFYVLAVLTGVCAIAVVVTQNIVRAAAWLLFALAGTAGVFFLLNASFVGATQLLVYVGGTLVLVVFGVMLTAQGPFVNMKIGAVEWLVALATGMLLYTVLAISVMTIKPPDLKPEPPASSVVLGESLLGLTGATPSGDVTGVPPQYRRTRTPMAYLLIFEIVSVHLLVVLIGAAYLARAKRRRGVGA